MSGHVVEVDLDRDVTGFCGDCGEPLYPDGSPGGGVGYAHAEEACIADDLYAWSHR